MLEFYKEWLEESEERYRLAKIGFEAEIKSIGSRLMKTVSYEDTDKIFAQIIKSRKVLDGLKEQVNNSKKRYREELDKQEDSVKIADRLNQKLSGGKEI